MWGKASSCNTLNSEAEGNASKCDTSGVNAGGSKFFKNIYILCAVFSKNTRTQLTENNNASSCDNAKGREKWVKWTLRENKCQKEEPQTEPIDTGSFFSVAAWDEREREWRVGRYRRGSGIVRIGVFKRC